LIKSIFNSSYSPKIEDLLLKNVKVVEGFYMNIISEALLKASNIWYLGYDYTLQYRLLSNNIILAKLKHHYNLTFIKYNKVSHYSLTPIIVNAVGKSWKLRLRTGDKQL
jgi:hypothetical protein